VEDLKKLSPEKFAREADAIKGLSKLFKQFKYHQIKQSQVTQIKSKKKYSSQMIYKVNVEETRGSTIIVVIRAYIAPSLICVKRS
jgi:hypothetical protein